MLIWNGWGWMVPVLALVGTVAGWLLVDALKGLGLYRENGSPMMVAMGLSALLVWGLNRRLARRATPTPTDEESAAQLTAEHSHSFFLIPMVWWPSVMFAVGIVVSFFEG